MAVSSNEFVLKLQLSGERFHTVSLDGVLLEVYDFAAQIWQGQRLFTFVDHGIDHSFKVIDKSLEVLRIFCGDKGTLTPLERLILGIAALIHDIGMQYDKYPKAGVTLSHNEIRSRHVDLGFEMITDTLNGTFASQRNGLELGTGKLWRNFLFYGALIGFAHSGTTIWDRLRSEEYGDKLEGGYQLRRLRLLAAAFRLADELHCEYTRINDLEWWVHTTSLTDEEKAHWAACYYTQQVTLLSPGIGGARIHISWRAPSESLKDDTAVIRTLLQDFLERKIQNEWELIKEYLKWEPGMEPCFLECKLDAQPERGIVEPVPPPIREFLTRDVRPYQLGDKQPVVRAGTCELLGSAEIDDLKNEAQMFVLSGKGTFSGHFRLKTGWHTNKYLRCRELAAQIDFSSRLSTSLAGIYSTHGFTHVLAIGTSMIGIGALLALKLHARLLYTFERAQISEELAGRVDYTEYEKEVFVPYGSKLLILDDILGVGSVIQKVTSRLREAQTGLSYLRVFCVYSLGEAMQVAKDLHGLDIDFLVSLPDVKYWPQDPNTGTCQVCVNSPYMIRDE
jgi:orotate phosphoribosyltransferase